MSQQMWTILLIVIGIIIIIYAAGVQRGLIRTLVKDDIQSNGAHQVYFLPTALLQIKALATVTIIKDAATGNIIDSKLSELSLETKVEIVPDTSTIFGLKYLSSVLANDDIKISISNNGLIEGLNLAAEDRFAQIIEQITQSPKIILSAQQQDARGKAAMPEDQTVITETKEFSTTFTILTKELRRKEAKREWAINIDGPAVKQVSENIELTLRFKSGDFALSDATSKSVNGILTRPLTTLNIAVFLSHDPADNAIPDLEYQVLIPDEATAVNIPIGRSAFVKKTYSLKISNGLVMENAITKPSEVEGFLSIPINIAKAFISIPAQLFSFKIQQVKLQTEHDTALIKTRLDAEKTLADAEKNTLIAKTEMANARIDWENTRSEMQKLFEDMKALHANKFKNPQADLIK